MSDLFSIIIYRAGLKSNQISVIKALCTGTPVRDPAEYDSVRRVFGGSIRKDTLSLGSVKGLLGHTESASGIVALLKTLLMIMQGAIPLQTSFKTINPSINAIPADNIETTTKLKPWNVPLRAALINNYRASDSNALLLVTQAPRKPSWPENYDDEKFHPTSRAQLSFQTHGIHSGPAGLMSKACDPTQSYSPSS